MDILIGNIQTQGKPEIHWRGFSPSVEHITLISLSKRLIKKRNGHISFFISTFPSLYNNVVCFINILYTEYYTSLVY